jgi:hypothetical protein
MSARLVREWFGDLTVRRQEGEHGLSTVVVTSEVGHRGTFFRARNRWTKLKEEVVRKWCGGRMKGRE